MQRGFRSAGGPNGPRRPARLAAVALTVTLTAGLAGCEPRAGGRAGQAGPAGAPVEGPSNPSGPGTPSGPSGMAPAAYQAKLASAAGAARASLDAVAAARRYGDLVDRVERAAVTVVRVSTELAGLDPPEALVDEHAELVASLEALGSELSGVTAAVAAQELCAAPSTMARVTGLVSAARVRAAGAALDAAAGRPQGVGALLPEPVPAPNRRLASGTVLVDRRRGGLGRLTVDNRGTRQDAVVSLVRGDRVVVSMYVAGGARRTLTRIADGSYRALQAAGVDWDDRLGTFTRECSFAQLDGALRFTTTARSATSWTVSFGLGGSATGRVSAIDPDEFPRP